MQTPIPNSYWVLDGLLLAGEYPGSFDEDEARERLGRFLDAGIRVFYDLTEAGELPSYDSALKELARERRIEATHERVPIRNRQIPDREEAKRLLRSLAENIDAGIPCYVHCWGGIGRTGTIVGCWLVERDRLRGGDALARIAELRAATPHGSTVSPETDDQCAFITAWRESPRRD